MSGHPALSNPSGELFSGGGEMGAMMRAFDWSRSPLGPAAHWPQSLRTSVNICLNSEFAILVWWGPGLVMLYNDAYSSIIANKHPRALGAPGNTIFPEIWDTIGPMLEGVMTHGKAVRADDLLLFLERSGYPEECYFSFSYSPIFDEHGGVGGVFTPVKETTDRIIGERRLKTLVRTAELRLEAVRSTSQVAQMSADLLAENSIDLPFIAIYLFQQDGKALRRAHSGDFREGFAPEQVGADAEWPPLARLSRGESVVHGTSCIGNREIPRGHWGDRIEEIFALPLTQSGSEKTKGFMLVGINPRKRLDAAYRDFLRLAASNVATAITDAEAIQQERDRLQALADLDRAKNVFFNNISHEFRTPLTLIMGPLEEAASDADLSVGTRKQLDLAHRNSLRLQRLVNNLLDFSRIEAGKAQVVFERVNLARLTGDLASGFHSLFEKAGLSLTFSASAHAAPVYVDRDMWEKIVLNLLSNAFKFTFTGGVTVNLRETPGFVQLTVADTGTGIPADQLPKIFQRFERIEGARGRSYEGTGIGLALVQELVKLHGGSIEVESELGRGTRFTVMVPTGTDHLALEQIRQAPEAISTATAARLNDSISEARRWVPELENENVEADVVPPIPNAEPLVAAGIKRLARKRLLVADDNADMRLYITRLLKEHFEVEAVTDGMEAMASIRRQRPDLLVTDVMMPVVGGLALLAAIRADPEIASLPVILLSARAGEESEIEGLRAGADDYLVKPFSARELVARISSLLEIADIRAASEQAVRAERTRLADLFEQAPAFFAVLRGPEHVFELTNPLYQELIGQRNVIGKTVREAIPEAEAQGFVPLLDQVFQTGEPFVGHGVRMKLARIAGQPLEERYLNFIYQPMREVDGTISGIIVFGVDVTEGKRAEQVLIQTEKLAAVGRLASSIAHEINNPLESVTNLLYLMESASDEDVRLQYLAQAQAELARAAKVATLTLRFHRQSTKARDTSLPEVLQGVLTLIEPRLKNAGIHVERQYRTRRHITAYEADLRQVFANLVVNAIDASEHGGRMILRVHDAVNWRSGEPGIRVSVGDTGVGMSEMTRRRIFDPFFTTKGLTGTGLGLWVSAGILQKHHATIRVRSSQRPDRRGTVFSIFFPLDAAQSS